MESQTQRVSHTKRNVIIVVVLLVAVVIAAYEINAATSVEVKITGVYLDITYSTSKQGCFGATRQQVGNSLTITGGAPFHVSVVVTNNGSCGAHAISSVYLDQLPFTLSSVTPKLPLVVNQSSSVTLELSIVAPSSYSGPLDIEMIA